MATTQFKEWLDNFDADYIEELVALYHTVENKCSEGNFTIRETPNGGWIVSYPGNPEELLIASEKAQYEFLRCFKEKFGNIDDLEFKAALQRNKD